MSAELAVSYAALILADDGIEITSDKLQTLVKSAGVQVENVLISLFAKALESRNVKELLLNIGTGGPRSAAEGAPAPTANETKVEEAPKEEEVEESDEDMGFGLFD
ncbi:unnamed protein product [Pneumocystis jirovecii]|uniref:60S acidic ribosomal protein P1 n=1 Tax=Pneumocystis jirovecii TaxID=42068 RepID=L0P9H0_PNEJI|nr:unnamed protein product [Pneumocystis jirovecii]